MDKITILLVDDHKLVRESWSLFFNEDPRFKVVGETNDTEEAVRIAKEKNPGIVLMDINMSPVNGFDGTKMMLKSSPESRIIGISAHSMPACAFRLIQIGAMGFVTKNSSKDELFTAILQVNEGKKYICNEIKDTLAIQELDESSREPDLDLLSRRELEIIKHIKEGLSSREIGLQLGISMKTVEVHRYNILKKLSIRNTAALVNYINTHYSYMI